MSALPPDTERYRISWTAFATLRTLLMIGAKTCGRRLPLPPILPTNLLGKHCLTRNGVSHDGNNLITCHRAVFDQSSRDRLNAGPVFSNQTGRFCATERQKQLYGFWAGADDPGISRACIRSLSASPRRVCTAKQSLTLGPAQQIGHSANYMRVNFAGAGFRKSAGMTARN
jgi:hypothetical protein